MRFGSLRQPTERLDTPVLEAENALVHQYADLVRLAYITLPPSLGRHQKVSVSHSVVQRALPSARLARARSSVPAPRRAAADHARPEHPYLVTVLRRVLAYDRRPPLWPARLGAPRALVPRLPIVLGLRLFPRPGGAEALSLTRSLAGLSAETRAAFVLCSVYGLTDDTVVDVLKAAGAKDAAGAVRDGRAFEADEADAARTLALSEEFDACVLQATATDLLRRRHRARLTLVACLAGLLAGAMLLAQLAPDPAPTPTAPQPVAASGLRAADLTRAPADQWDNTARIDFTAWPPRGSRLDDEQLLNRALSTWARPGPGTHVVTTAATSPAPPASAPQLLYAGEVDAHAVVLLYDGQRLARYREDPRSHSRTQLSVARVDDADVTTAAAVELSTGRSGARYLIAPWVAEVQSRDLLRPDVIAQALDTTEDGVTEPVPFTAGSGTGCDSRPVLQLRSSARIAERHAFLLAGLGDLSPVHLTYTPLPGHGTPPPRQPREATGPAALVAWSHQACALADLRGTGTRAVNAWEFAEQDLPDGGSRAVWTCMRESSWRGPGDVTVTLRVAGDGTKAPARPVSHVRSTALCSRFGQHIVAGTAWRSPAGRWYALAAGSRAVTGITVSGDVTAKTPARTVAVRTPKRPRFDVSAQLATGERLDGVTDEK
ncbi:hypothetical protein DI272_02415 [Streptomyces sp. Act143]|uniref:hypothetical protein n=1 Tax=Streptomyces sp. Act143 TaxID=2200760 RepID=UPI000D6730D8|nr:hypothetical protein [Streptomyces sp. Act143]PWI13117.1 hypothetical protein DI272_02415 [Streptomyces sp. Act143]